MLSEVSDKLKKNRKEIIGKEKELSDLQIEHNDLWKKLILEFNENKARYRKQEGLHGLIQALDLDNGKLIVVFDKNGLPSAKGLAFIEDDTGLTFYMCKGTEYVFLLN